MDWRSQHTTHTRPPTLISRFEFTGSTAGPHTLVNLATGTRQRTASDRVSYGSTLTNTNVFLFAPSSA